MRPTPAAVAAALLLAACAGSRAPPWGPEAPPHPRSLLPGAAAAGVAFAETDPGAGLWRALGDERLVRLLDEVRRNNPDLREAAARVRAARAVALRASRDRRPRLDGTAGASVTRTWEGEDDGESFDLGVDASWEVDLFGRLARARDAAAAEAMATEEDRQALLLSLQAEAADAWFDWGFAAAEEAVFLETEALLGKTNELVTARLESGLGDELAVRRVEGELFAARAEAPGARLRAAQARHRLALVLGRPPDAPLEAPPAVLPPPPTPPPGLPAALLRRRPDVRAAERRIQAEHARVAEAWAAFYPTVTIDGRAGVASIDLLDLFTGGAILALIAPRLRVPILDGGRLQAERLEAEANRDAAAAHWVSVALRSFSEVADAVAGVAHRREALDQRRLAVEASRKSVELAMARFPQLAGYLEVVESHRAFQDARLAEVREQRELRAELVRLARALGGSWPCP